MNSSKQVFAKQLRSNMTDAEKLLRHHLRGHRFQGVKFKRQQPLGSYIVDFVSFESKIVIEVDGGQHFESESDNRRDDWLKEQGFHVLRFWNNEVLGEAESVLEKILQVLTPSPSDGTTSHLTNPAINAGQVIGYPQPSPTRGEGVVLRDYDVPNSTSKNLTQNPSPLVGEGLGRGVKVGGKSIERVRWRSRRGLLELDIVLGRFIESYYLQLNESELQAFEELLDMPDNSLWDMIAGKQAAVQSNHQALLEKIKSV
jgi:very-short-patch-repair endonuclease/succinate dehydrogenase flavin-adding protein (antitoxin of CptAB toxin-antitoxin module)